MVWYKFSTKKASPDERGEHEEHTFDKKDSEFLALGLSRLKRSLDESIPERTKNNLIIGTWNIKEFGAPRDQDAVQYIAEVIERFDVTAVQEVRGDLSGLRALMKYLGSWYDVIYTDVTEGDAGNGERMAFIYDSRKISPTGLVGEIVIPPEPDFMPSRQLVRTPMVVGFRAGWYRFNLAIVHILYGEDTAEHEERVREIELIANAMRDHAERYAKRQNTQTILLGDFNIFSPEDETFQQITEAGFYVPDALQELPTSVSREPKHYDQIALYRDVEYSPRLIGAGVPNLYETLYREEDIEHYARRMGKMYTHTSRGKRRKAKGARGYYRIHWRTRRLSDHMPMWLAVDTNDSLAFIGKHLGAHKAQWEREEEERRAPIVEHGVRQSARLKVGAMAFKAIFGQEALFPYHLEAHCEDVSRHYALEQTVLEIGWHVLGTNPHALGAFLMAAWVAQEQGGTGAPLDPATIARGWLNVCATGAGGPFEREVVLWSELEKKPDEGAFATACGALLTGYMQGISEAP